MSSSFVENETLRTHLRMSRAEFDALGTWTTDNNRAKHATLAELVADANPTRTPVVSLAGHSAENDGGEGTFYWSPGNTDDDDDGMTLQSSVNPTGGRWKRAVAPGFINVRWFGIGQEGDARALRTPYNTIQLDGGLAASTTADTRATAIINSLLSDDVYMTPQGLRLYFPAGVYRLTAPLVLPRSYVDPVDSRQIAREIAIVGDGMGTSVLRGNFNDYLIKWDSPHRHARARFQDIALFQYAWSYGTIKHESTQAETDRLLLFMQNVRCEHLGTKDAVNRKHNLHLEGLLQATMNHVSLGGGSGGAGNSGLPPYAMYLKGCSESVFTGINMSSGVNACGIMVEDGGDLVFNHVRLDAGSRGGSPGYHFKGAKFITIQGLRSETGDADPSLLFEDCQSFNVFDLSLGGGNTATHLIELEHCSNMNFIGGYIDDKFGSDAIEAVRVSSDSNFIRFQGMRTVQFSDNLLLEGSGQDVQVEVYDSETSPFSSDPGTGSYYQPSSRSRWISGTDYTRSLTSTAGFEYRDENNAQRLSINAGGGTLALFNRDAAQVCLQARGHASQTADVFQLYKGGSVVFAVGPDGQPKPDSGDSSGSPGNATINKPAGKSAIAQSATAATITNSLVTTSTRVHITPLDIDANVAKFKAVAGSGSFTVTVDAAAAATWKFNWRIEG